MYLDAIAETKTHDDAVNGVITFSENLEGLLIYHEESTWQTFNVGNLRIVAPAGSSGGKLKDATTNEVSVPTGINFVAYRLE